MKINEVILVEGKYDKIKLDSVIDGTVIAVNGFRIFKDKEMRLLIKRYAEERGIIILTDSDSGGFLIRKHLLQLVPPDRIKNAYIPEIPGKEKRKEKPGKAGLLGVEGMDASVITEALTRAGCTERKQGEQITKADLFAAGLSGTKDSTQKRQVLLKELNLPHSLSPTAFLGALNTFMTKEDFLEWIKKHP